MDNVTIPEKGITPEELFKQMDEMKGGDYKWDSGKVFCLVYPVDSTHHEFLKESYGKFISENFLNPMAFGSLKKMEREVVRMSINLMHGDDKCVGTMTSGGTESIIMAVKAARELSRKKRPWIMKPEIVAPDSAHVALEKACKYFDIKYVPIKTKDDYTANVKAMKKATNRNTIMIYSSAPQYPQGVIDPIEELGEFAHKKKIPLHVDACVGGFMLPWLEKIGEPLEKWDFRVKGVTSISADLHKYGFAAKGASVVLYKSMDYMKHQFFITTNWPGGIYASPNFPGTRPGGAIAAAWATLKKFGEDGYIEQAKKTIKIAKEWRAAISEIPELEILGNPKATLHSFRSIDKSVDIYAIADIMIEKGWFFDRQQYPASIHMTMMPSHENTKDDFIKDLKDAVQHVKDHPELAQSGNAAMYGMMAKLPVRGMVKKSVEKVMESMWGADGELPDLENMGKDENAPWYMKVADKYGADAMNALQKIEDTKENLQTKAKEQIDKINFLK